MAYMVPSGKQWHCPHWESSKSPRLFWQHPGGGQEQASFLPNGNGAQAFQGFTTFIPLVASGEDEYSDSCSALSGSSMQRWGLLMTNWEKNRLESKLPVWPLLSYTWWCLAGVNDYYPVLLSVYLDNSFLGLLGRKSRLLSYFLSLIGTKAPHWSAYAHPEGNQ